MLIILILILLLALYLLAIMPRMTSRPDASMLMDRWYAHRGLHDNQADAPENSMAAFEKAVSAGYGIELDVQLTRDRVPVVFHDESLMRVCGIEGNVRDYNYADLMQYPLFDSAQHIPRFEDVLEMVDGRTPLIVEIKIHEDADEVCTRADALLRAYQGPYCIESFDPRAVQWYRKNRPQIVRGQLSCRYAKPGKRETLTEACLHHLLLNFLGRPDFIAYDHHSRGNLSRVLCRRLFRALSVAWTIRSQQELDACRKDFDLFIFEGFTPED